MIHPPALHKRTFWILASALILLAGCSTFQSAGTHSSLALSEIKLRTPPSQQARQYLGLKDTASFALSDIDANFIVLGYYGVKCPFCHEQAPVSNQIFDLIRQDDELSRDVKMIGVMIGSNPEETGTYAESFHILYPMTNDPFFEIYRNLGKTNVPLTLVMARDGRILMSKTGVIADPVRFVKEIRKFHNAG